MSDLLRAIGRDLGTALSLSYQAARLYPPAHPERLRRRERVRATWVELLAHVEQATIDWTHGRLLIGTLPIALDSTNYRDLLEAARNAGLPETVLRGAIGANQAVELLDRLATGATLSLSPSVAPHASPPPVESAPGLTARQEAGELLRLIWSTIQRSRQLDREMLRHLVRLVTRLPGDGLIEPVMLIASEDPGDTFYTQALNTARLVYVAARSLAPGARHVEELVEAALLADVGMLAVPPAVTGQPGRLGPEEFRLVRQHPWWGAQWLLATDGCSELAATIAFEHHMRLDAQGYPKPDISWRPLPASLLYQAADVYAALRSPRPFRPPLGESEARALLRRLAVRWLDASSVELLLDLAAPAGCHAAQESLLA